MSRGRIVVVDDDPAVRAALVEGLTELDFQIVSSAADGETGVAAVRSLCPEAALVDLRMPQMNGIEVVRALRDAGLSVPVVLLSAYDDPALIEAGVEAGAFDYVVKGARLQFIAGVLVRAMTSTRRP